MAVVLLANVFLGGGKCPNLGVVNVRILGVVNVRLANNLTPIFRCFEIFPSFHVYRAMREAGRSAMKPTTIIGEENNEACRFSKLWHFWLKRLRIGETIGWEPKPQHFSHENTKKMTDKGTLGQWQDINFFSLQIWCIEWSQLHKENPSKHSWFGANGLLTFQREPEQSIASQ